MLLTNRNAEWLPSLINEFFDGEYLSPKVAPATNIIENENNYTLQFAIPGMKKEELKISINEKYLTIARTKSEKKEETDQKSKYLRREFGHTEFSQTYTLPEDIDKTNISAKVENGVLEVLIPKIAPDQQEPKVKYVEIK